MDSVRAIEEEQAIDTGATLLPSVVAAVEVKVVRLEVQFEIPVQTEDAADSDLKACRIPGVAVVIGNDDIEGGRDISFSLVTCLRLGSRRDGDYV